VDADIICTALDRAIAITSIESDGTIVDAGTDVALTADSVVAVSSIEDATISDFDSLIAAGNASDFVVTVSRWVAGGSSGAPFFCRCGLGGSY
jgi:hypothetical protein